MTTQEPTVEEYLLADVDEFKKYAEGRWDHRTAYEVTQAIENWPSVQDARGRVRERASAPTA